MLFSHTKKNSSPMQKLVVANIQDCRHAKRLVVMSCGVFAKFSRKIVQDVYSYPPNKFLQYFINKIHINLFSSHKI